jgi:hypothetical protein
MAQAHAAYRKAPHSLAAWNCFQSTLALFSGDVLPHDGPWQEIVMDVTRGLSSVAAPLSPSFLASVLRSRIAETILPTAQDQDTHIRLMGVYDAYGLTHDVLMVPVCVETVSQPTGERLAPMHVLRAMGFPVDDDDPRDAIMAFLMHQPDVTLSYTGAPGRLMQRVLWFYPDCLSLSPEAGLDPEGDRPAVRTAHPIFGFGYGTLAAQPLCLLCRKTFKPAAPAAFAGHQHARPVRDIDAPIAACLCHSGEPKPAL